MVHKVKGNFKLEENINDSYVVILGASEKPTRFSYKAFQLLKEHNYKTVLVSPNLKEILGQPVVSDLSLVVGKVNTLTMYVNAHVSSNLLSKIIDLKPTRIIFNPGSENPQIEPLLIQAGIQVVHGCTRVMLNTKTF